MTTNDKYKVLVFLSIQEKYTVGKEIIEQIEAFENLSYKVLISGTSVSFSSRADDELVTFINSRVVYKSVPDVLDYAFEKQYDYILFTDNSYIGPFRNISLIFEDATDEKAYVLERRGEINRETGLFEMVPQSYFFLVEMQYAISLAHRVTVKHDDSDKYLNEMIKIADSDGSCRSFFEHTEIEKENRELSFPTYAPYRAISEYEFPLIKKESFDLSKAQQMELSYGDSVLEAINWIKDNNLYNSDLIRDYLIDNYSPYKVKELLVLNVITDIETTLDDCTLSFLYQNTAVAVHLFYPELFDVSLSYISNIPAEVAIFISVRGEDEKRLLEEKCRGKGISAEIVVSSNVGRDWGALYFDLWPRLKTYNYICFLHDKRTSGGKGSTEIGYSFMKMVWSSLLGSPGSLARMLEEMYKDSHLGLLSPQIPYHSGYITALADAWTVCFEKTKELAKRLHFEHCNISREDQPFAMSSMFMARKEVLACILDKEIYVDEFPAEPMQTDGTFNHALERLPVYAAKEAGKYSALVFTTKTASNSLTSFESFLHILLHDLKELLGAISYKTVFDNNVFSVIDEMKNYLKSHSKIYIYGTGNNGKTMYEALLNNQYEIEGFVVSTGHRAMRCFMEKPVYEIQEIDKNCGIVVAVDRVYVEQIKQVLNRNGFVDYLILSP